jgi:hypothetical protein
MFDGIGGDVLFERGYVSVDAGGVVVSLGL